MRRGELFVLAAAVLTAVSLVSSGWALWSRFSEGHDTRARIAAVMLFNCREIEHLKTAQRDEALKAWRNLDTTLRLLHLKKTRQIVDVARTARDDKLRLFAADPCPRRKI